VSEKRKKRVAVMAPRGRQSKRARSIPQPEFVSAGSSTILNRLKTTGAPEQHVPKNISPMAANSTGCDHALQAESPPVAENRDWSYAYDGSLDEDETEGNPIPKDDPISEGWFLCYPQDCCTNVCILVQ